MLAGAAERKLSVKKGGNPMRMPPGIDYVDWIVLVMTMLVLIWVIAVVGYLAVVAALHEPRHRHHWHRRPKHA
jgi:hypothetical protein